MRFVDHKKQSDRLIAYKKIPNKFNAKRIEFSVTRDDLQGLALMPDIFEIHTQYGKITCGMFVSEDGKTASIVGNAVISIIGNTTPESEAIHILQFSALHTGNIKKIERRMRDFLRTVRNGTVLIMARNKTIFDKLYCLFGLDEQPYEFAK